MMMTGASGSAYLYDFSDPCNIIEIKLTASDASAWSYFGGSVAIIDSIALVGSSLNDERGTDSGAVYLFNMATGDQIAKLTASDAAAGDRFGSGVALSGTIALVGAFQDDDGGTDSGSAYLYDFSDPDNIIETKLTASDASAGAKFGIRVGLSGSTALVGAYQDDDGGTDSGSAYFYDFSDPYNIIETKVTASDANSGAGFGISVALSGSTALVGAYHDDDGGAYSGSAYLFGPCPYTIAGDINDDCKADFTDFAELASDWPISYDITDLAEMAANWLIDCLLVPSDPACVPK